MLNKFNVKEVGSLEERIVHLAMDEGLKLQKASLESNAVLTNVFLCGQTFGDRVKIWIAINKPLIIAKLGYDLGIYAPGRISVPAGFPCREGNSVTEPYMVNHSLLLVVLAHATIVELYRETRWTKWN
ncbi:beta-glucosidase 24-like isoform X2 [Prunus yedoensis var. nudiflora]|uniref:Beta-glucosidase 24-like isoform X2 n=1 Tax=Prunus yedoensis var. nudiflora TaxID=2094558 RepID=A0A314Z074_PRUYE|nr:beta-glucosidase 24-like isoform X2 [Prunus yedoensis var. nudiflora]